MKIGPHINGALTAEAARWASRASIVKQLDGVSGLAVAPPGAITVFRKYFVTQDLSRNGADVANDVLSALGGFRRANLYVELYVGTGMYLGQGLEEHLRMTREAVPVLHAAGVMVAGFSFYTGNGNMAEWIYLHQEGFAGVDALSLQEYWFGAPPGGFDGWNALRYRRVHQWLNGQHPPIIITEFARHALPGVNCGEHGDDCGWLSTELSGDPQGYVNELLAYDAELRQDDYILGGCGYTSAPNYDWITFDLDRVTHLILPSYDNNNGGGPPMPAYNRDQVWSDYLNLYNPLPALIKVRAENPELGDAIERDPNGNIVEHDYGKYRIAFYAGGVAWAEISNWGNRGAALDRDQLPFS